MAGITVQDLRQSICAECSINTFWDALQLLAAEPGMHFHALRNEGKHGVAGGHTLAGSVQPHL